MNQPTWHILGFGAIGQILHSGFVEQGQACKVIAKAGQHQGVKHSVTYEGQTKEIPIEWARSDGAEPITHLVVCTKSYDAIEAMQSVAESLNADSQIIILINGMLDTQDVEAASKGARLFWGLTTEGGYRTSPLDTIHAGTGLTKIGGGDRPYWFDFWVKAHERSEWVEDIEPYRWQKLCINAAINPLTALNACLNGELMHEPLTNKTQQLITELSMLLTAKGFTEIADAFPAACREVIQRTAQNQSSMRQDTQNHKKTEVDLILPPLLDLAHKKGVSVPALTQIYRDFKRQFTL